MISENAVFSHSGQKARPDGARELRALLVVLTSQNFAFGPKPVFVFLPRSASSFLVQLVSALADLALEFQGLGVRRGERLPNLRRRGHFRHGQNLFFG